MSVIGWVYSAVALVIGAFILYVLIQSFSDVYPGFGQYGWALMAAYIAGAILFLKYGLSRKN